MVISRDFALRAARWFRHRVQTALFVYREPEGRPCMKAVIPYPAILFTLVIMFTAGSPWPVQSDAFIKLGEIAGECSDKNHIGWSDVVSWKGTLRPVSIRKSTAGSGQITPGKIVVVKPADASSDELRRICRDSLPIPEVRFEILKPGSDPPQYMVYVLRDVVITSMWQEYSGDLDSRIVDSLSLSFGYGEYHLRTLN